MNIEVTIVNAFVDGKSGGNPAGVVLNADSLSSADKLKIAQQVGLSETAFVSASERADFKLDFFTPQRQIAHCGHATVAAFSLMSQRGLVPHSHTSKETIDGIRDIRIDGDLAYMQQTAPRYQALSHSDDVVLQSLGLSPAQVDMKPVIVNTGNGFLLIGVNTLDDLNGVTPDMNTIEALSEAYDLIGFYVFSRQTNLPGRDASARMFAPRYGITEESATGMAAGPLACLLHDHLQHKPVNLSIEQGYAMRPSSPSCINVQLDVEKDTIVSLKAGGVGRVSEVIEVSL
ncbi:PhzF family phenazine biosynthesis protein [Lacimicrobium sp. SS2-24]|uniref:PhzF family phenazine biosynthesis protein n=1 Tax=Lacimicrobium sp. SS2-24 TaxID=2005569 RepID=UPI000B4ABAD9|nr:PhzF family phenazine biosynthesis protein [Lacimicrobium sp. SS2-24]